MSLHRFGCCAAAGLVWPLLLIPACVTSSEDVDLSTDAALTLVISRVSDSALATATAEVAVKSALSSSSTTIVLASDQVLYVNDVPLTTTTTLTDLKVQAKMSATLEAVDPPDKYKISFDNQGVTTSIKATPPADFTTVSPAAATEVPTSGFDLTWSAPESSDSTISVQMAGLAAALAEDGSVRSTEHTLSLTDLADDGALTVGATDLALFLTGDLKVTLTRGVKLSQKLGFSSGTIRLEIQRSIPLELVEPTSDEASD